MILLYSTFVLRLDFLHVFILRIEIISAPAFKKESFVLVAFSAKKP